MLQSIATVWTCSVVVGPVFCLIIWLFCWCLYHVAFRPRGGERREMSAQLYTTEMRPTRTLNVCQSSSSNFHYRCLRATFIPWKYNLFNCCSEQNIKSVCKVKWSALDQIKVGSCRVGPGKEKFFFWFCASISRILTWRLKNKGKYCEVEIIYRISHGVFGMRVREEENEEKSINPRRVSREFSDSVSRVEPPRAPMRAINWWRELFHHHRIIVRSVDDPPLFWAHDTDNQRWREKRDLAW